MRAVDTNVLVRLIARDDARQTAAAEVFVSNGAWVSLLALTETVWMLGSIYDLTAAEQAKAVELLLDHRQLVLHNRETVTAALQLFRSIPSLGFSDCLGLELARRAGHVPLGTFDRKLGKVDGAQRI